MQAIWEDDELSPGQTTPQTWIVEPDGPDYINAIGDGEVVGIDPDSALVPVPPTMPPQGGVTERPPDVPAVSGALYALALGLAALTLLGGRRR